MLKRNRANGFSLVELLLVVAIIGILALIAVPSLTGQRKRAKMIGDAQANTRVISIALEERRAELGFYGDGGTYEYTADGNRPEGVKDIIRSFQAKGNSRLDFKITIGSNGLTYEVDVSDPLASGKVILQSDQTGEMLTGDKIKERQ
jgi:prepilin-type N-terminal cleavage/methylation domain-containing protein